VIVVRKLGVPFQPELGMGAVGEDDVSSSTTTSRASSASDPRS
jgi:predicted phosphoribosyltransferase